MAGEVEASAEGFVAAVAFIRDRREAVSDHHVSLPREVFREALWAASAFEPLHHPVYRSHVALKFLCGVVRLVADATHTPLTGSGLVSLLVDLKAGPGSESVAASGAEVVPEVSVHVTLDGAERLEDASAHLTLEVGGGEPVRNGSFRVRPAH